MDTPPEERASPPEPRDEAEPSAETSAGKEPEPRPAGDRETKRRRWPNMIVTGLIILLISGCIDLLSEVTSNDGRYHLRQANTAALRALHNLAPLQVARDFMVRLDSSEYGWWVLNLDAPFNVTEARDRIENAYTRTADAATSQAKSDPSMPAIEDRIRQEWLASPDAVSPFTQTLLAPGSGSRTANLLAGNGGQQSASQEPEPFDELLFQDAVTQALNHAAPVKHFEGGLNVDMPEISVLANGGLDSPQERFDVDHLNSDPDFLHILSAYQSQMDRANDTSEDQVKHLKIFEIPGVAQSDNWFEAQDQQPNFFVRMITKIPGLLDAYIYTVRRVFSHGALQATIGVAALLVGALLVFSVGSNTCFSVVVKLFLLPVVGSVIVGAVWLIALGATELFGRVLAAPALEVTASLLSPPLLHWGVFRILDHHAIEKGIEKYAQLSEKAISEEESKVAGG